MLIQPEIAVDGAGDAVVAWVDLASDASACCGHGPVVVAVRRAGGDFSAPHVLGGDVTTQPLIGIDDAGGAIVVAGGYMFERPPGGTFGAAERLSGGGAQSLAVNARGDAAIGLVDRSGGLGPIRMIYRPAGGKFGEVQPVNSPITYPPPQRKDVSVGIDPQGRASIAFLESDYVNGNLHYRTRVGRRRADGSGFDVQTLEDDLGDTVGTPVVSANDQGNAVVAYSGLGGIYAASSTRGGPFSSPARVSTGTYAQQCAGRSPDVKFDPTGVAFVLWYQDDCASQHGVWASQLVGGVPGSPARLAALTASPGAQEIKLIAVPNGELLAAWPNYGQPGTGWSVYTDGEAPTPASQPPTSVRSYAALGDSVASGEGINYGFQWGGSSAGWTGPAQASPTWDQDPQGCHKSNSAYPWIVKAELEPVNLEPLACTGSSALNGVLGDRTEGGTTIDRAQLGSSTNNYSGAPNASYDDAHPDYVSLTLGADDVNFVDVLTKCFTPSPTGEDCYADPNLRQRIDDSLAAEKTHLQDVLDEILRRGQAAGKVPVVAVTDYYDPFPTTYDAHCRDLFLGGLGPWHANLSRQELQFVEEKLEQLNDNIRQVVRSYEPQVQLVELEGLLRPSHTFCGNDPWAYGPSIIAPSDMRNNPAPFHPTPDAQVAIGERVAAAFRKAEPIASGSNASAQLGSGVSLTFDHVDTAGFASANPAAAGSYSCPAASSLNILKCFDLATSAQYVGNATLRIASSRPLSLFHFVNGAWHSVATTFTGSTIEAQVSSFSPYALATSVPSVSASFSGPTQGVAPAAVSFDGTASHRDGGGPLEYAWDFGDGAVGAGATPSHTYSTSGSYHVQLTVTSADGASDTVAHDITVTNPPPKAVATIPTTGTVGQAVSFSAAGSTDPNGSVASYDWDFGDGSGASTPSPQHSYSEPGTYPVKVVAYDDEGASSSATQNIAVSAAGGSGAPPPDGNGNPGSGAPPPTLPPGGSPGSNPSGEPPLPHLANVHVVPRTFRARRARSNVFDRGSARLTFSASAASSISVRAQHRIRITCPHKSGASGKGRCYAYRNRPGVVVHSAISGLNRLRVSGWWKGTRLPPGSYRFKLYAVGASNKHSVTAWCTFTIR